MSDAAYGLLSEHRVQSGDVVQDLEGKRFLVYWKGTKLFARNTMYTEFSVEKSRRSYCVVERGTVLPFGQVRLSDGSVFDTTTNRVPFGLLSEEEQQAFRGFEGAGFRYWAVSYYQWVQLDSPPIWQRGTIYQVLSEVRLEKQGWLTAEGSVTFVESEGVHPVQVTYTERAGQLVPSTWEAKL